MEEKRLYYRAFRAFGGMMLFLSLFTSILETLAGIITGFSSITIIDSNIINEILMLMNAIVMIYSYYLGYRIFIKQYDYKFIKINKIKTNQIIPCIISSIFALCIIRISWPLFFNFLDKFNLLNNIETTSNDNLYIITFIYTVIVAPIFEEIVFRYWGINLLKRYGNLTAIIITAIAFGLFHANLYQAVPAFIIGLVFGYLAIKYNSILPTTILHILNNLISSLPISNYEDKIFYLLVIGSIIGLVLFVILNIKKIIKSIIELPKTFKLSLHSISLIIFIIINIILIVLTTLGFNYYNSPIQ